MHCLHQKIIFPGAAIAALVCAMGLPGCSVSPLTAKSTSTTTVATVKQYHAYGDSITSGDFLDSPTTQAYPALTSGIESVAMANYAMSGAQACDIAVQQIFPHSDSPSLATLTISSLLIGTNDVGVKGVGAYETIFQSCHLAAISWLAMPLEAKVLATSSQVVTSGAGAIDTANNWNSWTTAASGASVSFPITLSKAGPVYAWVRIDDTNTATYNYSLDGVLAGTGSVQTTPSISTKNGSTNSLGFLRLAPVAAGTHVVTFTQTSSGTKGVSVVGIGSPAAGTLNNFPIVFVGYIPYQYNTGRCTNPDYTQCSDYSAILVANAVLLAGDGLNLIVFDPRIYLKGTAADMANSLHPNALGHQEMAKALEVAW